MANTAAARTEINSLIRIRIRIRKFISIKHHYNVYSHVNISYKLLDFQCKLLRFFLTLSNTK